MEKDFILTSSEYAKLIDISAESLRSRRRRGLYEGQYILRNKSYYWKRPRPNNSHGPQVLGAFRLAAHAPNTNSNSRLLLQPRRRNKNSGRHKHGARTFYPNKAFELANEFKMVLKSQRRIAAAAAEEITPDLIKLAEEKHREKVLKKLEPVTVTKNYGGIFNPRYSSPNYRPIKYQDEIEDTEREFWSRKPYY